MLTVAGTDAYALDLELRIPFTFGITTLTDLPHLFLSLTLEVDGGEQVGLAAEHLAPKWFTKDPDATIREDTAAMLDVVEHACEVAREAEGETPFDLWLDVYERQREWGEGTDHPALLWAFGPTLVERAIIDAFCRARGTTFPAAVRENALGIRPGAIHDELAGREPADFLPAEARRSLDVRHTVGYTDPLVGDDLDEPIGDGLPETLADYVAAHGLRYFKVKLSGDPGADADRLARVAAVVGRAVDDPTYTADANEQYDSVAALRDFWSRLEPGVRDALAFVEQPFDRRDALDPEVGDALDGWADGPPVVIDESDARLDSARVALDRGYAGTSYKGCKGVFKGIANAGLIDRRRREDPDGTYLLSAEDLTTVGPVGLLQDLAVVATLGIGHVERNGYHYFRGASALPGDVQDQLLADHGDLYARVDGEFAALDIEDGSVDVGSLVDAPFGLREPVDVTGFTPIEEWTFDP